MSTEQIPIEIEVEEVKKMIDSGADFLLVDCREASERDIATIDGSVHIPMRETVERHEELKPHQSKSIVVHCHHGGRSLQVTHWLRSNGFDTARNMSGGIDEWSLAIDKSIPRY